MAIWRRTRPETPGEAYARALAESTALHLHLGGVRVAALHGHGLATTVTLTWRSATSVLLDADGRPRGQVARNALTTAYTVSLPVRDATAVGLLSRENDLGTVSVYGTTDLVEHPAGTLSDCGVVLDQLDLDFPTWSASLPLGRDLTTWES